MADGSWRRFFLAPTGDASKAWRLPVLLRGRRKRRMFLLVALGLGQSVLAVVIALSVREGADKLSRKRLHLVCGAWRRHLKSRVIF